MLKILFKIILQITDRFHSIIKLIKRKTYLSKKKISYLKKKLIIIIKLKKLNSNFNSINFYIKKDQEFKKKLEKNKALNLVQIKIKYTNNFIKKLIMNKNEIINKKSYNISIRLS